MNTRRVLQPLASLRLTVILLGIGMVLVFAATLDQVNLGIHAVEKKYIRSLYVLWQVPGLGFVHLPLPGGYLLGSVLLVNLLAAHVTRFKLSWKKSGIFMIHLGVILLIVGEILRGLLADETRMSLDEGQSSNYSEALREVELVVIDRDPDQGRDQVVAIPQHLLEKGGEIRHPSLPFSIHIQEYLRNSNLEMRSEVPKAPPSPATTGLGVQIHVEPRPVATKPDEVDLPSAFVEIRSAGGALGTWLLSSVFDDTQSFTADGKTFHLALRGRRDYKAFSLGLIDFSHDRYAGTDIPKNFSSRVRLKHPEAGVDREVLIYMNNPLRYGGYTFYQASFANAERTSILQVVKNPAWLMPYVAFGLVGVGMLLQFSSHLGRFSKSRRSS